MLATLFLAAACFWDASWQQNEPLVHGLDQVSIAVRDLEGAVRPCRGLGFEIKPGREHENGIANAHIKFPDGTEIELISAPRGVDALTREYRRFLDEGEGPAFVSFYAPDLDALSKRLEEVGREHTKTSSTITFPVGDPLRYIFFGKRQKSPSDKPEHFAHRNGAASLERIWIASDDPCHERELLRQLGSRANSDFVDMPMPVVPTMEELPGVQVMLFPGDLQVVKDRKIVGVTILVESILRARTIVHGSGNARYIDHAGSLFLPPEGALGLWIEFRAAKK